MCLHFFLSSISHVRIGGILQNLCGLLFWSISCVFISVDAGRQGVGVLCSVRTMMTLLATMMAPSLSNVVMF